MENPSGKTLSLFSPLLSPGTEAPSEVGDGSSAGHQGAHHPPQLPSPPGAPPARFLHPKRILDFPEDCKNSMKLTVTQAPAGAFH